jgi:hypothetical protein
MANRSANASDIAACGGMTAATRRYWVGQQLLAAGPEFSEHDAWETAVLVTLIDATTSQRAPEAFLSLRAALRERVIAGRHDLWLVVPRKGRDFVLTTSAADAARRAAKMRGPLGPVWLVSVRDSIDLAKRRYADLEGVETTAGAKVTPLRTDAETA